jgi:hypothetical protein
MTHKPTSFRFMMKNLFCLAVFFSFDLALAGMVTFKDGNGQIYQIDASYTAKNGARITRIRWPDNAVDVIKVEGCSRGSGDLTRYDKSERKKYETLPWSLKGTYLIDRVAREVCKL